MIISPPCRLLSQEVVVEHVSEILSFLGGLVSGWTLKVIVDSSRNTTKIKNNRVGGDLAGRDLNKK